MSLYEELGLPADASPADIRAAYRRRASKTHPDKGGDKEEFQRVQKAYAVLSDESARKRYDSTGAVDEGPTLEQAARQQLAAIFASLLDSQGPDINLVQACKRAINQGQQQGAEGKKQLEKQIKRLEAAHKRLLFKGKGPNFLSAAVEQKIKGLRSSLEAADNAVLLGREMKKILKEYKYDTPQASEVIDSFSQILYSQVQNPRRW